MCSIDYDEAARTQYLGAGERAIVQLLRRVLRTLHGNTRSIANQIPVR